MLALTGYQAERAASTLASRLGRTAEARESDQAVLAFLETALSHVAWHPALSLHRCRLAAVEGKIGSLTTALSEVGKALMALTVTHGK